MDEFHKNKWEGSLRNCPVLLHRSSEKGYVEQGNAERCYYSFKVEHDYHDISS
jgi:hypothetical protein